MTVSCRIPVLCVALTLTALACRRDPQVLALVGDDPVTLDRFADAVAARAGRPLSEISPELAAGLFEGYLEEEVILIAGGERTDLAPAERSARARELLKSLCPTPQPPTEAELDARLEEELAGQEDTERLLLRQLILPDRETAVAAQRRARAGEDFGLLSRELSRAPNAAQGGLLGWVVRGQLPPEFEAAIFGLEPGGVSAPVASNAGWHVFLLVDRRTGMTNGLRERARANLAAQRAETTRRECMDHLARTVRVEIVAESPPFPVNDPFGENR